MGKIVLRITDYHPEITIETEDNEESISDVIENLIEPALRASGFSDEMINKLWGEL